MTELTNQLLTHLLDGGKGAVYSIMGLITSFIPLLFNLNQTNIDIIVGYLQIIVLSLSAIVAVLTIISWCRKEFKRKP